MTHFSNVTKMTQSPSEPQELQESEFFLSRLGPFPVVHPRQVSDPQGNESRRGKSQERLCTMGIYKADSFFAGLGLSPSIN
jgi:hypothetical protein